MTDQDSGYVRPLLPDGSPDPATTEAAAAPRRSRATFIGGVVLAVLVAGAVGGVILWRTLVGGAFASADAIPIDADIVVTFDLLQVRDSEPIERLIRAFTVPAAEQGLIEDSDVNVLDAYDTALDEEIGMTLSRDVVPWIGRSVSIAVWFDDSLTLSDLDTNAADDLIGGVVVAGVRDAGRAEAFVAKLASVVSDETGASVEEADVAGGVLTSVAAGNVGDDLLVWLDGDLMIAGPRLRDIERALDALEGESILDRDEYTRVTSSLPSDRLMAMYIGADWLQELYADPLLGLDAQTAETIRDSIDALGGVGMAMTLRDEGVMFDLVYGVEDIEGLPFSDFDASNLEFLDRLPADTLFHIAAPIDEGAIADAIEPLRDIDPAVYDDLADQAREFLGVDLFEEVLPALGREAVFAVAPAPEGFFASQLGVEVGGVLAIGVTDRGPVATAVSALEDMAIDSGLDVVSFGGVSVIRADRNDVFAYAVGDDTLAIGTGPTLVGALLVDAANPVSENARYRELDSVLPGSGVPVFIDLQGIFDVAEIQGDERDLVDALRAIGASGVVDGDTVHLSALIAIDY